MLNQIQEDREVHNANSIGKEQSMFKEPNFFKEQEVDVKNYRITELEDKLKKLMAGDEMMDQLLVAEKEIEEREKLRKIEEKEEEQKNNEEAN